MATVTTTSVTNPLIYPGTTLIDYTTYDGYHYAMVRASTADTFQLWRTLGGASWALYASVVRTNIAEIGSIYTSPQGYISWCYRTNESSQDRIYYRRFTISTTTWSPEVLLSPNNNGGVAGSFWGGCDVVTIDYGPNLSYQAGMVIAAQTDNGGAWLLGFNSLPGANPQANNGVMAGNRQFLPVSTTTGHHAPSIDLEHAGNGKVASVSHLWATYGRNRIHLNKIAWTGTGWAVPTGMVDISGTTFTARDYIPGRWDGQRFIMCRPSGSTVILYERNRSNTKTTTRTTPAHTQGVVRSVGLSYNSTNQNPRVYGVGTSTNDLYYVDYDRSGGTWGSWTIVTSTDITGAAVDNYSPRRGTYYNAKHDILTGHAGVDIVHFALSLVFQPVTPTWSFTAVPYVDGSAADVNASLLLDWNFNHPDPAEPQGSYAVRRQIGAGAFNYWRASDSTWQVAEVQNTAATTQLTLASSWGAGTDANHSYWVKTWDSIGVPSLYSAPLVLVPSVKVNPTITQPADLSTWTTDTITVMWTVSEQTAFQAQLCFFGIPLEDSGKVVSTATQWTFARPLENTFNFTIRLWTWNLEGLQSTMDENSFVVTFVGPRVSTVTVTAVPANGYMTIQAVNPGASTYVGVGAAAQGNNATLTPAQAAGVVTGDLLVGVSAIENSGTGVPDLPTDYTNLLLFGNVRLFGKIHDGSEAAPSCSYTGGVAGAATTAQMAAFRESELVTLASATQLNGSAANIATPALTVPTANCIVLYIGWKQDGTGTSVATPAGFAEIGDIVNANGQMLVWGYQVQTTAANISSGSLTVTGGVSAISRGIYVAISGVPSVAYNEIYRLQSGAAFADEVRIADGVPANGAYNDFTAVSRINYWYRTYAVSAAGVVTKGTFTP